MSIKKEGNEIHRQERELFRGYYFDAKQAHRDGTAKVPMTPIIRHKLSIQNRTNMSYTKPCVCVDLIKMQKKEDFSDDLAAYISGSILQAGSETTSGILVGFIQAMVIFPEAAKKAQMELDRICGDRFPTLDDWPNLPYVRACAKETLRWMPGFFLGIPHAVTQDDMYLGYRIPKGATVILNAWYGGDLFFPRCSLNSWGNAGLINLTGLCTTILNDIQILASSSQLATSKTIKHLSTPQTIQIPPSGIISSLEQAGEGARECISRTAPSTWRFLGCSGPSISDELWILTQSRRSSLTWTTLWTA